ncbi:XI-2, partial [Symbiodinium sp. CCMP2456]
SALCSQTRVTRSEKIRSPVNVRQAADNRDALAKAVYGIVFNFIVQSTNMSIGYVEDVKLFAGVLDIFGFECFKMNSFEQLCINFTNERLQQFFNSFVFKLEEQLYEREGIEWDPLDFPDNQDAVDMLQAKGTGVFAILDEECVVPQGSDQGFNNKLIKQHRGHRRFDEIKTKPSWFVIKHFAGPVSYCSDGFLDKNKDQLSNDLIECMGASTNEFIVRLFRQDVKYGEVLNKEESSETGTGKKKKKYTVSSEFKDQLASLMDIVDLTEPHFVRCIKPNPQNEPDRYDRKAVTEQLRYGGVLQVVQVSRAGYPVRINHQECWDDFKVIASPQIVSGLKHVDDSKVRAQKLLEHLASELNVPKPLHGLPMAVGKTLVFFKLPAFERLKFARLELLVKSATQIQAAWRRRVQMGKYKAICLFTRHIQALLRSKQARSDLMRRKQEGAAVKLQSLGRQFVERRRYKALMRKVVKIQAWHKGICGRRYAKEYRKVASATRIQRNWKRWKTQRVYKLFRQAVYVAQERLRMHAAKSQMKKLKQEAKEVGALMAKSQKAQEQATSLRKRNEELEAVQLQLQSEKKSLQMRVKELEESLEKMKMQMDEVRASAEEAAKLAADSSKMVVETESQGLRVCDDCLWSGDYVPAHATATAVMIHDQDTEMKIVVMVTRPKAARRGARRDSESDGADRAAQEQALSEKTSEISQVKEELVSMKEASSKQQDGTSRAESGNKIPGPGTQEQLQDAESRYQNLLKSTAMQSIAGLPSAAGAQPKAAAKATGPRRPQGGQRNVFIQLAGAQSSGKTSLPGPKAQALPRLEALIAEHVCAQAAPHLSRCELENEDPQQLPKFNEQKSNFMAHHQIQVGDKPVKMLDCSGNSRAAHLVKERFARSTWVFIVYDLSKKESLEHALALTQEVHAAGARPLLFGNKYNVDKGDPIQVDVAAAKDAAVRNEGDSFACIDLPSAVLSRLLSPARLSAPQLFALSVKKETCLPAGDARQPGAISSAIDSVKSWFGGERAKGQGVLRPSLKGTKAMKQARKEGDPNVDLRPVQELQDSDSAVTCICFGQERLHKAYVLLATASKDGTVVVYRCYRTEMEIAMLDHDFAPEEGAYSSPPADHSNIAVHSRLVGHSRAITSIFFNLLEDQLVTTSIDKSVRFWSIDSGEMLKVFTDSSSTTKALQLEQGARRQRLLFLRPVPVAAFLPFNPQVFVAANSNAVLRLVNVQNGMVLQKLKVETEVRALKFDDTGLFLLAGTKSGSIHVLEASDANTLKFKFKVNLARGGVTCITFVPAAGGQPPCLLVNTSDCSATIIDCTYGPPSGVLNNLAVRHRVRVAHELLPLKNCFSPSGPGYLISGSENKDVLY